MVIDKIKAVNGDFSARLYSKFIRASMHINDRQGNYLHYEIFFAILNKSTATKFAVFVKNFEKKKFLIAQPLVKFHNFNFLFSN